MNKAEVLKLAQLARIDISDDEAEELTRNFDSILGYVGEVKGVKTNDQQLTANDYPVKNVMREDTEPHESGVYTERLLAEAPSSDDQYVKVKKIL